MKGEMKPIMRFMWGSKQMRQTFFCGFELLGSGGILLLMTIATLVPVVTGLLGVNGNENVIRWSYTVAFVLGVMLLEFLVEIPYAILGGNAGKGLRSIPHAKGIMTKGLAVNCFIFYGCELLLMLGMQGVGVALGVVSVSYLDDSLFLFGLFYLLLMLLLWFGVLLSRLGFKMGLNSGISVVALIVMMNAFGKLEFSIGLAAGLQVAFFVCGTALLYPVLFKIYKNREIVE